MYKLWALDRAQRFCIRGNSYSASIMFMESTILERFKRSKRRYLQGKWLKENTFKQSFINMKRGLLKTKVSKAQNHLYFN